MNHVKLVHEGYCEILHCGICEGGLFLCTVCGGAEGSLPRDCPGVQMTPAQEDKVMSGDLDYRDGQWVPRAGFTG
jgi:hypothetical protein